MGPLEAVSHVCHSHADVSDALCCVKQAMLEVLNHTLQWPFSSVIGKQGDLKQKHTQSISTPSHEQAW